MPIRKTENRNGVRKTEFRNKFAFSQNATLADRMRSDFGGIFCKHEVRKQGKAGLKARRSRSFAKKHPKAQAG